MSQYSSALMCCFADAGGLFQRYAFVFSKGRDHISSFLSSKRSPTAPDKNSTHSGCSANFAYLLFL